MTTLQEKLFFRPAKHEDIEPMCDLLEELFTIETDFRSEREKQRCGLRMLIDDKESLLLVAVFNVTVMGMCSVQPLISTTQGGKVGLVEDVIVKKEFRGLGIGKQLLDYVSHWSVERGMSRLQLLADRNNAPALRFYDNIGWSKTGMICLRKFPTA